MEFPRTVPFWGNDRMHSSMLLRVRHKETGEQEDVLLSSVMELGRGNPYRLASGLRTIEVQIHSWRARGLSNLLGKTIEYRLSSSAAQPKSSVMALGPDGDFPAAMTFNAVFDVFIDDQQVLTGLAGTAHSTGLMSIPPRGNDIFAVNKPFEVGEYAMEAVECAASEASLTTGQKSLLRVGRALGLVPKTTFESLMPRV